MLFGTLQWVKIILNHWCASQPLHLWVKCVKLQQAMCSVPATPVLWSEEGHTASCWWLFTAEWQARRMFSELSAQALLTPHRTSTDKNSPPPSPPALNLCSSVESWNQDGISGHWSAHTHPIRLPLQCAHILRIADSHAKACHLHARRHSAWAAHPSACTGVAISGT